MQRKQNINKNEFSSLSISSEGNNDKYSNMKYVIDC